MRRVSPATLSGKITLIDPAQNLVVVETPNGVTLDRIVTLKPRINSGDQTITLKDPIGDINRTISVKTLGSVSGKSIKR
jgi:hypothetical protein